MALALYLGAFQEFDNMVGNTLKELVYKQNIPSGGITKLPKKFRGGAPNSTISSENIPVYLIAVQFRLMEFGGWPAEITKSIKFSLRSGANLATSICIVPNANPTQDINGEWSFVLSNKKIHTIVFNNWPVPSTFTQQSDQNIGSDYVGRDVIPCIEQTTGLPIDVLAIFYFKRGDQTVG